MLLNCLRPSSHHIYSHAIVNIANQYDSSWICSISVCCAASHYATMQALFQIQLLQLYLEVDHLEENG